MREILKRSNKHRDQQFEYEEKAKALMEAHRKRWFCNAQFFRCFCEYQEVPLRQKRS